MVLPAALESAPEVPVKRAFSMRKPLSFAEFRVTGFRPGARTERLISAPATFFLAIDGRRYRAKQSYRFALEETNGPKWAADCTLFTHGESLTHGDEDNQTEVTLSSKRALDCTLRNELAGETWTLRTGETLTPHLRSTSLATIEATLQHGDVQIGLRPTNKLKGTSITADIAGYVFTRDERILAAAEVTLPGSVRFASDVTKEERRALAAASAALLLAPTEQ